MKYIFEALVVALLIYGFIIEDKIIDAEDRFVAKIKQRIEGRKVNSGYIRTRERV